MTENVILLGVVGSTAYGLTTPSSDRDRLGVYQAPTAEVLGLRGAAVASGSHTTHSPEDLALHELGKYVNLALSCNPHMLELLWLASYEVRTDAGAALVDARGAFLSERPVRNSYGGYAISQARRLRDRADAGKAGFSADLGKRTAKHGRHCLRLLRQGTHLLRTGELLIDVSHMREELFAAGELAVADPAGFEALFEGELAALDAVESVLPDQPEVDRVNRLVVDLRVADLRRAAGPSGSPAPGAGASAA